MNLLFIVCGIEKDFMKLNHLYCGIYCSFFGRGKIGDISYFFFNIQKVCILYTVSNFLTQIINKGREHENSKNKCKYFPNKYL